MHDVFDVGAVNIVIRWAAELRRMVVSWPWLRRHGVGIVAACSRGCNSLGGGAVCFACPPPVGTANAFNLGIVGG